MDYEQPHNESKGGPSSPNYTGTWNTILLKYNLSLWDYHMEESSPMLLSTPKKKPSVGLSDPKCLSKEWTNIKGLSPLGHYRMNEYQNPCSS